MRKTVVITGANSGIGKAAAIEFAKQGYEVVMACRNMEISQPVCREIIEKSKNDHVELLELDVSSKKSIVSFCEAFKEKYDVLDLLVNNAGHFKHGETSFQQSEDGMELTFATNLFGPVLLSNLLLDVLSKSEDPRILNACSTNIKHFFDERRTIDFNALWGKPIAKKQYDSYKLYGDSKMALLMATFKMAQEYKTQGVAVNAIMIPATKMSKSTVRKFRSYWRFLAALQNPFIPKAEVIGDIYVSISTGESYGGVSGKLINHRGRMVQAAEQSVSFIKVVGSTEIYPPYADDEEASTLVWAACSRFMENSMSIKH